jgi:NADPH-dependent stearoyl-CoA 9-desaturase
VEALSRRIQEIGREARTQTGAEDVRLLRRLKASTRIAEALGRLCLHFAAGPWTFALGVASLAYYLAVEAQLNHSVMHGAYIGLPGAGRFVPSRYETLAIPFQSRTWGDAHRIHHAHPSLLGQDPDTVHPLFRMHQGQPWRPWHAFNAFIGAFFTFEHWAYDYDRFLKAGGKRPRRDRRELRKFLLYAGYQLVLFPVLAGARWKQVLIGGLLAIVIRNLIFTGLQTGSSVGHEVSTRHCVNRGKKPRDAWYRFQIETSKNFAARGIFTVLCGGLDRHIEHHLFPRLPPNRLHAVSGDVRELCRSRGVRYAEYDSLWETLRDSLSYLQSLASPR